MRCPYCDSTRVFRRKDLYERVYACRRCAYQFEVSLVKVIVHKIFSFPYSSIIYYPIIMGIIYLLAMYTYVDNELKRSGYAVFLIFFAVFILLFFGFTIVEENPIFLMSRQGNQWERLKGAHPLFKLALYLFISAFFAPFVFNTLMHD